ncbi:MAG: hypothetical protein NC344_08590 [Bacteroidales bacterium]|nr:hypothetical protein [Bacteroidales bacterium]MCM1147867.1 hypothetical protein [Bacteroidales bacterium]MCM1206710.1 hypothetical protein [Bacillota bacterium]MCM1510906.1 hypothetical protein [Clostridium sp.]
MDSMFRVLYLCPLKIVNLYRLVSTLPEMAQGRVARFPELVAFWLYDSDPFAFIFSLVD